MNSVVPGPRTNSSGLLRDIELLDWLGGPEATSLGGLSVTRLAQLTQRDKSVVSRALATLAAAGFVTRDPVSANYTIGSRLFALAARSTESMIAQAARPLLRKLTRQTRETSHLCVLRGGNVLTTASELSPHEFRTTGWEGVTTAAWRTPSGRVLISDWDRDSLAAWYEEHGHDEPLVSPPTAAMLGSNFTVLETPPESKMIVHDFDSLLRELARIRARGFATLDEELELGVVGASAPVYDLTGRIIAAINVSAPKSRLGSSLDALGEFVRRSADELSLVLGHSSPAR